MTTYAIQKVAELTKQSRAAYETQQGKDAIEHGRARVPELRARIEATAERHVQKHTEAERH